MTSLCRAFDHAITAGSLVLSTDGDLWERLPDPREPGGSRWSWYGPVTAIKAEDLPKRHRDSLARIVSQMTLPTAAG